MAAETLLGCWNALQEWGGTEERLPRINMPTLIIYGERDSALIVDGSRRLAELISGARLCTIAGAAHCPQEEQPEAFKARTENATSCPAATPGRPRVRPLADPSAASSYIMANDDRAVEQSRLVALARDAAAALLART
jgi:hypothetical protein